jgi:hypothetical protein
MCKRNGCWCMLCSSCRLHGSGGQAPHSPALQQEGVTNCRCVHTADCESFGQQLGQLQLHTALGFQGCDLSSGSSSSSCMQACIRAQLPCSCNNITAGRPTSSSSSSPGAANKSCCCCCCRNLRSTSRNDSGTQLDTSCNDPPGPA